MQVVTPEVTTIRPSTEMRARSAWSERRNASRTLLRGADVTALVRRVKVTEP